jgi:hypothetical protein
VVIFSRKRPPTAEAWAPPRGGRALARRSPLVWAIAGAVGLAALLPAPAARSQPAAEDWPCVQRLVPRLEGGQVWSGPPLPPEGAEVPPEVQALARELADPQLPPEAIPGKVEAFAGGVAGEARAERLTQLFAAALATLNGERAETIQGIRRYARGQQRLAERIAAETRELDGLERSDPARAAELRAARDWDTRVHADRQRQLTLVCDQPVRLEQRAFALGRAIQERLP